MRITPATFPTPDLIKKSNNPAIWDQQGRFALFQAAAANEALDRLGSRLANTSSVVERAAVFVQLYRELAEWRYQLAHRAEGQSPNARLEQYHSPIGHNVMIDPFGGGLHSAGSSLDRVTATLTAGEPTPASRISTRLAEIVEARFAAETPPGSESLQNRVLLPDGRTINGNQLLRGRAAARELRVDQAVEGLCCTITGRQDDRRGLQREAFGILAELETERAGGRTDLVADPDAQRAFVAAEYYLYQGPEYQRGGDATIRVLLAASHTRVFGAAPKLPQDIDVMAYVAGQAAFHEHVGRNQTILPSATSSPSEQVQAAVRVQPHRSTGFERD